MDESAGYIVFVRAAYAIAFVILGGVTVSSILRFLRLKKQEKECDKPV